MNKSKNLRRATRDGIRLLLRVHFFLPILSLLSVLPSTLHSAPSTNTPVSSLEEGKALFESGRYQDAISKFIMVLRSDPQNSDARQYLRQSVDQMRQNPAAASRRGINGAPPPTAQAEMREMLQKRAALTLDLMAIPGLQVTTQNAVTQVEIATPQLFEENKGGLKEEGIPILDRVAAWLKTFGQQPILIHCYPEELQDVATTGSLFLRRYSELYNFFTEERKMSPQRLISADMLADQAGGVSKGAKNEGAKGGSEGAIPNDGRSRIVIETMGSQSAYLEGAMPSASPKTAIARWLEFAIISHRDMFNPDEGEWATLDLAALSRTGLRNWAFKIVPETSKGSAVPVYEMSGTGNILKRLVWDGRNNKTGSLVPMGGYVVRINATDSDGTIKSEQITIQVQRTTGDEATTNLAQAKEAPSLTEKTTPKKKKKKKKAVAAPIVESVAPTPTPEATEVSTPAVTASGPANPADTTVSPPAAVPTPETPATEDPAEDSSHAIWKQVIQFDLNAGQLAPSVTSSLERIGKTLEVYPLQKVRIVGFASTEEKNAAALAKQRAEEVRSALLDQYHVDSKRVLMGGTRIKAGTTMSKVELSITN